jgi:hypothetical protein
METDDPIFTAQVGQDPLPPKIAKSEILSCWAFTNNGAMPMIPNKTILIK